jgi:hypothetical protein
MIFKAYLDEANTSVREPDMTVAGFLGTARQWRVVERELRIIKRRLGFQSFHGVEFKGRRGNFAGWSNAQSMQLVNALARLVREELTEAIEFTLPWDLYATHYRGTPFDKGVPRYSQYGICIFILLEHLMKVVQEKPGCHVLDLIVEDGHKNAGAARVVFEDTRKYLKFKQIDLLGTVTLAKKKDCELLMMADFQAHASGVFALQRAQPEFIVHGTSTPTHRPDEAAVTSISLRAETFASIKSRFTWLRESRMAASRAKRQLEK